MDAPGQLHQPVGECLDTFERHQISVVQSHINPAAQALAGRGAGPEADDAAAAVLLTILLARLAGQQSPTGPLARNC